MIMAIPARQRWILYVLALAFTLAAVRWAGGQDRTEPGPAAEASRAERPVREAPADAARPEALPEVRLDQLVKRTAPTPNGDPFQPQSWAPQEQAVRRALPPPRPQAPPLPFAYLGKLVEEATTTVFLAKQDRNYIVRPGDTIDGTYRIEEVGDEAVVLVYLPLKTRQTLRLTATPGPVPAGARPPKAMPDDEEDDD
jgi:hypothetical protein